jgi:hypothetical protein
MKTWLRLLLILVSVGGGFTGAALTAQVITHPGKQQASNPIVFGLMLAIFCFVTVSGILFVYDPRRTKLLQLALWLQVPWISSSILLYKLLFGFAFYFFLSAEPLEGGGLITEHLGWQFQFGALFQHRFS